MYYGILSHDFLTNRSGESGSTDRFYFLWPHNHCGRWCSHEIKRCLLLGRKAMTNQESILKSRDITLLTKVHTVKAMIFPVVMYGCETQTIKKAEHWRTDAFELWCWKRLFRVPWTARRSNQSILKEINHEYSLEGLTDAEAEAPILWPPDAKSWLIGKDPDDGKDWGQEVKEATEDEMVRWHYQLKRHEFEQTPGDSEGQGRLTYCSPWGCKESDMPEWLNNTLLLWKVKNQAWNFLPGSTPKFII